ncbi:MAG: M56 family metallopeptidase [Clostridiales bacterium]|nr:M56 family metallopeptidase [Clostridiales bacterium]
MNAIFAKVLEMSLYGSIAILVVLLFRLIFRKLPKRVLIVFWMIVAVRLVLPINFASPASLLNAGRLFRSGNSKTEVTQMDKSSDEDADTVSDADAAVAPASTDGTLTADPQKSDAKELAPETIDDVSRLNSKQALAVHIIADIWLLVIIALCVLFTVRYLIFYSRARWKSRAYDGSYFTTNIESPFVIGFFSPKIFIPEKFDEDEKEYILNHEWTHIKNKDGVIKLISYLILVVHWFNPLVWLAFLILCGDIEMRVDEETTEAFDMDMVKEYCISLVKHAYADAGGSFLQNTAFSGLGFGGMETKIRIKNLLKNKEVKKFMPVLAIIVTFSVVFFASSRSLGSPIEDYFAKLGRSPVAKTEEPEETEESEPSETPSSETAPSSETEAPSESTGVEQSGFKEAYIDILNKLDPNKPTIKCALLHIDYDQTPELIITDSWDCRYNGFKLTIYTYVDGKATCVLDQVDADDAYSHFYCYQPGTGAIYLFEETDYGDPSVDPYVIEENTIIGILSGRPSDKENYVYGTPDWVILGHEDVKSTIDRLTTWNIPEDSLYEKHPKYPPKDAQSATVPPTTTTQEPTITTTVPPMTTQDPDSTSTWRYHATPLPIDDYTKYIGKFSIEEGSQELTIPYIDYANKKIEVKWFFYRTATLDPVMLPYEDSIVYFYYQGYYDENYDGVIDSSEFFYRKATLELWPDGIRIQVENCDSSEIVPELDVSESFGGCYYITPGIYYYPLTSRVG